MKFNLRDFDDAMKCETMFENMQSESWTLRKHLPKQVVDILQGMFVYFAANEQMTREEVQESVQDMRNGLVALLKEIDSNDPVATAFEHSCCAAIIDESRFNKSNRQGK